MADYLLDTSVLGRCLRGIGDTLAITRALTNEGDLHISALSHLEILAEAQPREEKRTLDFLTPFLQLAFDEKIAESAARLVRDPTHALNFGDAIIAATALEYDLMLVTYQKQNFAHVPDLKVYAMDGSHRA